MEIFDAYLCFHRLEITCNGSVNSCRIFRKLIQGPACEETAFGRYIKMLLKGGGALVGGGWAFDDRKMMTASHLNWMILTAGTCSSRLDRARARWPCEL